MVYTDAHKYFLQIITSKRLLLGPEVKTTYEKCCQKFDVSADDLKKFVDEINDMLTKKQIHLAIRDGLQEDFKSDTQCFVLVSTLKNAATKTLSTFNPQELELFRKIIEHIVSSENSSILEMEAINLATSLENKMKIGDSESLIDHLVSAKWLLRHESTDDNGEGSLSLSALTILELQIYLQKEYEDLIKKCFFCSMISLKGFSCLKCGTCVHRHCGSKFWRETRSEPMCPTPNCKHPWPHATLESAKKKAKVN